MISKTCLVSKVYNIRSFAAGSVKSNLKRVWNLRGDFRVTEKGQNIFIVGFEFEANYDKIMRGVPWLMANCHMNFNRWLETVMGWNGFNRTQQKELSQFGKNNRERKKESAHNLGPCLRAKESMGKGWKGKKTAKGFSSYTPSLTKELEAPHQGATATQQPIKIVSDLSITTNQYMPKNNQRTTSGAAASELDLERAVEQSKAKKRRLGTPKGMDIV
ncbi:hypothetical protein Tsubulata_017825 [Turnera subulata]|uniref:DUF4283 domain-containing protein n=1 Tax=Turnera subulata TaxID=218843 RepID=A0A9Q0J4T2_9ROSI|nr:hypothetical protein Tsubulata_017825 [Turnera subulata]